MSRTDSDDLATGVRDARAYVGPPEHYDLSAAVQFNLLTSLGLREEDSVLDIGCGSLRAGRLLMVYLQPGNYYGLEPNWWLVDKGIETELGWELIERRRPDLRDGADFDLQQFDRRFDFLLAQSIFSHAPPEDVRTCLGEAAQVLAPGGRFCATVMPGDISYTGDCWQYPGLVTYRLDDIHAFARDQGLVCRPLSWPHPSGQTWLVFTHPGDQPEDLAGTATDLRWRLEQTRKALQRLNEHPWVRIGRTLNRVRRGLLQVFR